MWFLGMDVGTGGTRAVVVNDAGRLMGASVVRTCSVSSRASGMGGAGS